MDKLSNVFYYYTLFLLTALFITTLFYLDSPDRYFIAIAIAPSLFYYWLKVTNPSSTTEAVWSARFIAVIVLLSGLLIFGYYLKNTSDKNNVIYEIPESDQSATLSAEIKLLREQVEILSAQDSQTDESTSSSKITSQEINDLINSLPEPIVSPTPSSLTSSGSVRVVAKTAVNIYEKNSLSSKITGIAEPMEEYDFLQDDGDWYMIRLENQRVGWIQSKEVIEFK